jgi:hypothetical protein
VKSTAARVLITECRSLPGGILDTLILFSRLHSFMRICHLEAGAMETSELS